VLGLQLGEDLAEFGLAVGQPLVEGLLSSRGDGGGVMFAFADIQAEEDADVTGVDHVHSPVVPARPSHGTDRHIHITASRPAKKPVVMSLISGLSVPPEPVTPPHMLVKRHS
jgi:hypothetical protein